MQKVAFCDLVFHLDYRIFLWYIIWILTTVTHFLPWEWKYNSSTLKEVNMPHSIYIRDFLFLRNFEENDDLIPLPIIFPLGSVSNIPPHFSSRKWPIFFRLIMHYKIKIFLGGLKMNIFP